MSDPPQRLRSGPLMQLLSSALSLWVRSRCDSIAELQLQLHGSAFAVLRGRLEGATLRARDVHFQGLQLHHVDLQSSLIVVDLKLLRPGQIFDLQHPFQVQGEATLNSRDLDAALLSTTWRWLGDWLAEQLMGVAPLAGVRIDNDVIELQAAVAAQSQPLRQRFLLEADQGSVRFRPESADGPSVLLPMDPAVRITGALLGGGQLHLTGNADVTV